MKYIFLILVLFVFLSYSFASDEVQVSVSEETISISESTQYSIEVYGEHLSPEDLSFDIPGIENFSIFSQSISNRRNSINGQIESFSIYSLHLQPKAQGDFTLGPVEVFLGSGSIVDDEIVNIRVQNTKQQTILPELGDEKSGQVEGIKPLREVFFPWWGIVSAILAFLSMFYLLLRYMLSQQKKEDISENIQTQVKVSPDERARKYFLSLQKEIESLNSQKFFKKYNAGIRQILFEKGINNAHKATLQELKTYKSAQQLDSYKIFIKSYKYEYSDREVSVETRKKYIDDIVNILKK